MNQKTIKNLYNNSEGVTVSTQLSNALSQAALLAPLKTIAPTVHNRYKVAKRVFQLAASGGFPYTGMTYKHWAKKWLPSESFRLVEIDIHAAASAHLPKNPERVAYRLLCAQDSIDPIVVDLNKQKIGKSHLGYIPKVVVVDGKHRKQGQILQGHTRILAWVGCKAEKYIQNVKVIDKLDFSSVKPPVTYKQPIPVIHATTLHTLLGHEERSPIAVAYNLHCATVPAQGQVMQDQSGGEGGSHPRQAFVKAKKVKSAGGAGGGMGGLGASLGGGSGSNPLTMRGGGPGSRSKLSTGIIDDCNACGARSTGQLEDASATDKDGLTNPSDAGTFVLPSDRRQWVNKPNIKAPGAQGWESGKYGRADLSSPGSGVGPVTKKHTGASRSEMSRLADSVPDVKAKGIKSKGKIIDKIYMKAPPGWSEDTMHKLKRKHGTESAFKIAWDAYNEGKGEMDV